MPLFLLPNLLCEEGDPLSLPANLAPTVQSLQGLIAESEKPARRYLKSFNHLHGTPIALLNEHTTPQEIQELLQPLLKGESWGLISDAGLPCIADPGSSLVFAAQSLNIPIHAISGPSSLFLSLMLSGLPSQRFAFHGYIGKDLHAEKDLHIWQERSRNDQETQIFIDTPYRSDKILATTLRCLHPSTLLTIAAHLTHPSAYLRTATISTWKHSPLPSLHKIPTIFLFFTPSETGCRF